MTDAVKPPNCPFCGRRIPLETWNRRAPPAGWKPIETAPDGITVLVANISSNGQVNWVCDGIRGKGVMRLTWYTLNGNHIPTPTHFTDLPNGLMPLSAAPENDDE